MTHGKERWPVVWICTLLVVSLAIQLIYAMLVAPANRCMGSDSTLAGGTPVEQSPIEERQTGFPFRGDEVDYYRIAVNLLKHHNFSRSAPGEPVTPTAYRQPLFPIALWAVFSVAGLDPRYGLLLNHVCALLLVPLSYWVGSLLGGRRCGLIAALIVTLWPHRLYFSNFLLTEALFSLLVTLSFGLLIDFARRPSTGRAILAGLAIAAALLTRSAFLLTLFCLPVFFIWVARRQRAARHPAGLLAAVLALSVSPWLIRNCLELGRLRFSTESGIVFAGAQNPIIAAVQPGSWTPPPINGMATLEYRAMSEAEREDYAWSMGIRWFRSQSPGEILKLVCIKTARLWAPVQRIVADQSSFAANVAASLLFLPVIVLSLIGSWRLRSQTEVLLCASAYLLGTTIMAAIFWGTSRFLMPVQPILWAAAAHGAAGLYRRNQALRID